MQSRRRWQGEGWVSATTPTFTLAIRHDSFTSTLTLDCSRTIFASGRLLLQDLSGKDRSWRMASVAPLPAFWRIALVRCVPTARTGTEANSGRRK